MIVLSYLFTGLRKIYLLFWGVMAVVFIGLLVVVNTFGPWDGDDGPTSAWSTVGSQAPMWFLFTIGIMLSTVSLPVVVAHGITRRAYCLGAAIFAVISAVLFGLLVVLGYGVEYLAYDAMGVLSELDNPYPVPTVSQAFRTVLSGLGFVLSGWVVGLCFYRLSVWLALASLPLAVVPIVVGLQLPAVDRFSGDVFASLIVVLGMAVAGYLLARNVPLRPKKA